MLDAIEKEINGFYARYAKKEGITMAEAKKRVAKLDIEAYERKAAKYVKEKNFSEQANKEMRLYNLTMKVNRLELLKANIGLELVSAFDELQKFFEEKLDERTINEFERQAGILGKSVRGAENKAHSIVNASFHNARYSDRIWMYQDMLKAELDSLLSEGLIQGRNARVLARHLRRRFGVSQYNAERLMITELSRVQTEAQRQSLERNGYDEYTFLAEGTACPVCRALNNRVFKVAKMLPGTNAPPMHPMCRCSTAAYMSRAEFEKSLQMSSNVIDRLKGFGIVADISNAGNYNENAIKNLEKLENLVKEYNSTIVSYEVEKNLPGTEGGEEYMINGRTAVKIRANTLRKNAATDSLKLGDNQIYYSTYHEFAHTLSQSTEKIDKNFWKEIRKIRQDYRKQRGENNWFEVKISDYADKSIDEFFAEGFTQAKLSDKPSEYSKKVLEVTNKFFKR